MANKDNKCADLHTKLGKSEDWDFIFDLQKRTQEGTYGFKFNDLSLKELASFWCTNKHALEDELSEMFDALGGIDDGIGNAAWKYWKANHVLADKMTIDDLSDRDLKELKFEIVDAFHFLINFAVSINMTGSQLFNMYISKNAENIDRQKNNY
tara:strand:+ start:620 stop:1078 length:459 start_codon:yes stop_codon:yes gene_type:complete